MLEQITKINNNLSDIRNAISEQGVEIDASTPLAEYADKILAIQLKSYLNNLFNIWTSS